MAEKFVSFEDAAKELKKTPDELKGLVDEGKIRSFMDAGKMKFRRKDLDDLKTSLGIVLGEDEELALAPPDEVPEMPPMPATEGEEAPPRPRRPVLEEEFGIEPIDDEPAPARWQAPAKRPRSARRGRSGGEEEEVASLSDFEIGEDAEEKGRGDRRGRGRASFGAGPPAFRSSRSRSGPTCDDGGAGASRGGRRFAAVMVLSFAFGA